MPADAHPADPHAPAAGPTPVPATDAAPEPEEGLWSPRHRRLTAGLVLTVTLVAFESLAVATVMPIVADDLGGLGLYGWVFSGFFLGSLLGIVIAGQLADRVGTRLPQALGLVTFTVGLLIGGLAPSMPVLVVGRVLQGMGAGVVPAIAYTSVGRTYPPALRPRVFAVFSSAWVIPGLLGPAAASAIEGWLSWRYVFLALLPFVALAAGMALPAMSDRVPGADEPQDEAPAGEADEGAAAGDAGPAPQGSERLRSAAVLVGGVALVLGGLGADQVAVVIPLVAIGAPLAAWAFLHLVPAGTARLAPGLPAAVATRGILTFAFFGTDAYIALALTDALDQDTWVTGVALTLTTLTWTGAAWVQQRLVVRYGPRWLVRRGLAIIAVSVAGTIAGLALHPVVVIVAWTLAGAGIGLCYAPISVTVLGTAPVGEEGKASASLQLTDVLGVSLGTGVTGVFVALGESGDWSTGTSLQLGFVLTLLVAAGGVVGASRLPTVLPGTAGDGVDAVRDEGVGAPAGTKVQEAAKLGA